ncbi:MAG: serine--tRNA ligase [Myxococcota bacterium]
MLDPNLFANDPDRVRASLKRRRAGSDAFAQVDALVALVARRRALQTEGDRCRAVRNELSPKIGALMKAGDRDGADALKAQVKAASDRTAEVDAELATVAAEEQSLLLGLPNLVADDTPDGASDKDNPVVRKWGSPRPDGKPHDEVATALGMYDPERAAKLSGSRFYVLSGPLAALERALISFFCDVQVHEHGYTEVLVPYMVTRETMTGTGQLPKFEEDLFKLTAQLAGQDAYLIPTAEVPVTNLHRDEILEALPKKYCAFTPCFRSEAGSWGKDTRGLIRLHQFHKVEMVQIVEPDRSAAALEEMTGHAEACLKKLGLPYQVVARCAADVGFGGAKGYDLEVWLPGQQAYREISSVSSFTDFQARRLKLRFKKPGDKKTTFAHTLNGSGLAVGRTLVAILENYQEADGSVVVPEALRPYMRGLERIRRAG